MARLCLSRLHLFKVNYLHFSKLQNSYATLNYVNKYTEEESHKILTTVNQDETEELFK